MKAKLPEVEGVCVKVVPSTVPPLRLKAEEVAAGVPAQVPLVNHLKVAVPVGVPTLPATVTLSCTVVPAVTVVTVL